ncbi:hypothetical protein HII36_38570 [Nonomuraea sp. NN258]|uniref:hypothetical protein n=1 Tax=Nonomuraea antri TaxID=2730852 RepID=UPI001568BB00|nr:hypothetical protein [Nonomuraea antri]NRQ37693.1 hypothetical protein [Nonomuraea antri]
MRTLRTIGLAALLAAGSLALPGALASSASAESSAAPRSATAMALTLGPSSCEALARRFLCEVSFNGAVAPVSIRWFVNGFHLASYDNRRFVGIGCQPTFRYDIRAVISDATGATVEFRTSPTCRSGNP